MNIYEWNENTINLPVNTQDNYDEIEKKCIKRMHCLYGENPHEEVSSRLKKELAHIKDLQIAKDFIILASAVKELTLMGAPMFFRGGIGSCFAAFLLKITDINPLSAHYLCEECHETIFLKNIDLGIDAPDKICPHCKKEFKKDGFNIPYETFFKPDSKNAPYYELATTTKFFNKVTELIKEKIPSDAEISENKTITIVEMTEEYITDRKNSYFDLWNEINPKAASFSQKLHIMSLNASNISNIEKKNLTLSQIEDLKTTRDDVFLYLLKMGIPKKEAFDISEAIRKGKYKVNNSQELLKYDNIPKSFIDLCNETCYLPKKAYCIGFLKFLNL